MHIISLSQAINTGVATISERGTTSIENVHWLRLNNSSDKSILINSGRSHRGWQTGQDGSKGYNHGTFLKRSVFSSHVRGRRKMERQRKKFAYSNFANGHLRKVLDENKNQVLIWREVGRQLDSNGIKSNTLAYLSRSHDKNMMPLGDEYFEYFKEKFKNSDSTIVGFVCITGNKIMGTDIYAGKNLFYGQLEPLLRGYIDDAIFFGSPVTMPEKPVKEYMDKILTDQRSQEEFVNKNGKLFRDYGKVVHINTY